MFYAKLAEFRANAAAGIDYRLDERFFLYGVGTTQNNKVKYLECKNVSDTDKEGE